MQWFLGDVDSLFCMSTKRSSLEIDTEDTAETLIKFKSGTIAEIHLDYTQRVYQRNYEFFGAPHAVFLGMHETFGTQTASDVGMFAQTLMLAMHAHGIASCPQGTLRNYPDFVREVFGLEPEIKILFGISFGFEDPGMSVNEARTERAPLSETVQLDDLPMLIPSFVLPVMLFPEKLQLEESMRLMPLFVLFVIVFSETVNEETFQR